MQWSAGCGSHRCACAESFARRSAKSDSAAEVAAPTLRAICASAASASSAPVTRATASSAILQTVQHLRCIC